MPRQARRKSESGIYHIILRGINQQTIFHDDEDNRKFLFVLNYYKNICNYKILAYCLMKNHIHLLLKEEGEDLSLIMKRIAGKYVYWYNAKYNRIGHLFQDRFKSEPVEDDAYLITALRYIHQNPVKAQISPDISEYPYSSYNEYISGASIADIDFISGILEKDEYIEIHKYLSDSECLEIKLPKKTVTDENAKIIFESLTQSIDLINMDREMEIKLTKALKANGLSVRQIIRLTPIKRRIAEIIK